MRVSDRNNNWPRISWSFKRLLLALNNDLDKVKSDISTNSDYGFVFDHSIFPDSASLTTLELTVLYLEDRRFFCHAGAELRSFARGAKRMVTKGSMGGMSTIDQQVVRISLKRYERTPSRKLKEIFLAYCLNSHKPKRQILNYYIYNAYLGYRMEGCEVAAQKCFGIPASELNHKQSAFIASLFPLPFPKVVWDAYGARVTRSMDPDDILDLAVSIAPRWAARVRYKMSVAKNGQDFIPSNL